MKFLRFVLISTLLALASTCVRAGDFRYRGFSGGMMLHTGYLTSGTFNNGFSKISGAPIGLGGQAAFHFGTAEHHLCIGGDGYVSKVGYKPDKSYNRIGGGGLMIDYMYYGKGRVKGFVGVTLGGGVSESHSVFPEEIPLEEGMTPMGYNRDSFFMVCPHIGMEIRFAHNAHIILKVDYNRNVTSFSERTPHGPRIFLGVVFHKMRRF
ncbi:MAG: hypothetical protein HUJ89_05390 [Bacteroidales bacterium]|nr:hypothetical protein [Bacteroidales bacterium]